MGSAIRLHILECRKIKSVNKKKLFSHPQHASSQVKNPPRFSFCPHYVSDPCSKQQWGILYHRLRMSRSWLLRNVPANRRLSGLGMIPSPLECWAVRHAIDRHKLTIDSALVELRPRFAAQRSLGAYRNEKKKKKPREEVLTSKRLFLNACQQIAEIFHSGGKSAQRGRDGDHRAVAPRANAFRP